MDKLKLKDKDLIFALDIGTRNVVGILGYEEDDILHVIGATLLEHKTRAMLDGQIHDIEKVTEVIKQLIDTIEGEMEIELTEVAIAAAGRVLKTITSQGVISFSEEKGINKSHIDALEMQGVETAKQMLYDETKAALDYYCVAYTSTKYYLDGYEIDNLEGHKGSEIKCSIIATFLPKQVVDSLYTAVQGVGLTVSTLTLEPISAINLAIPKNLRLLNLALVDIGAGTSDIAITKEGSISAYGMLPLAGDEFTERLVEEYLIDFNTAEIIKKQLSQKEVKFTDILGIEQCVPTTEIMEKTEDILNNITKEIAGKILELNGGESPKAIFCVGGGSQFPKITLKLSEFLQVNQDRIVVKDINSISDIIQIHCDTISGPEYITPVGICLTTMMERKNNFISVVVNGDKIKLLNSKLLTVMDAAIKANFYSGNLIVRNGNNLKYTLNGNNQRLQGGFGIPPEIEVNQKPASLKTQLKNNDSITISAAVQGKDATQRFGELLEDIEEKQIVMAGRPVSIKAITSVNGRTVNPEYEIKNGDDIVIQPIETLKDLMKYLHINEKEFIFYVNENLTTLQGNIKNGDDIQIMQKESIEDDRENIHEDKVEDSGITVYVNGDAVKLKGKKEYIFVDVFNYIDLKTHEGKGTVHLLLNGDKTSYTDAIKHEDRIDIYWVE